MHQPKKSESIGTPPKGGSSINDQPTVISYAAQLRQSGLFELHEKVTLKLKVFEAMTDVIVRTEADLYDELYALIESLLLDLGIAVLKEGE